MKTVYYYENIRKQKIFILSVACFALMSSLIFLYSLLQGNLILKIISLALVYLSLFFFYQAWNCIKNVEPLYELSETALIKNKSVLFCKHQEMLKFSWCDIESVSLEKEGRHEVITIFLKHPEQYLSTLNTWQRRRMDYNLGKGFGHVVLSLETVEELKSIKFYQEICNFIN